MRRSGFMLRSFWFAATNSGIELILKIAPGLLDTVRSLRGTPVDVVLSKINGLERLA